MLTLDLILHAVAALIVLGLMVAIARTLWRLR